MVVEQHIALDRIVQDPAILGGKPVVRGTRIAVEVVLDYLAHYPNFDDLFADYPRLTMEDIQACLERAQTAPGRADPTNSAYWMMK